MKRIYRYVIKIKTADFAGLAYVVVKGANNQEVADLLNTVSNTHISTYSVKKQGVDISDDPETFTTDIDKGIWYSVNDTDYNLIQ